MRETAPQLPWKFLNIVLQMQMLLFELSVDNANAYLPVWLSWLLVCSLRIGHALVRRSRARGLNVRANGARGWHLAARAKSYRQAQIDRGLRRHHNVQ